MMRTTLDIADDVLAAAKTLAAGQKTTTGEVISQLARQALTQPPAGASKIRNGFRLLPRRGVVVTPELIDRLLDDDV